MALREELDKTIRDTQAKIEELEESIESLQRELAKTRQIKGDAVRLFEATSGAQHALRDSGADHKRERPRADLVLAAMETANCPVTLDELVNAMPDGPERGAVSAVVHRAIKKGEVRRVKRGVYELTGRLAVAS